MNFTQMHDRLRLELLRRIQRGTLTVSLLARQTGYAQAHLSNFLHSRRHLSLKALDRILTAQHLAAADLLPVLHRGGDAFADDGNAVPIVSQADALFEPAIRPSAVHSILHLPPRILESFETRASAPRRAWQRFVAVKIAPADAQAMDPLVSPEAIALIDRHYTALAPYRSNRANLYAVRNGAHLILRYVDLLCNRLVLRPHNLAHPVELIEMDPGQSPGDLLVGRVALVVNEM
jgi:hypothetical protein